MPLEDQPYTTADEDPFNVLPFVPDFKTIKHGRSSMLDKWIQEQQSHSPTTTHPLNSPISYLGVAAPSCSRSNPYLAYPDLPRASSLERRGDVNSLHSYDLVEDDDIPSNVLQAPQEPVTPVRPRTQKSSRHSLTPSFRSINLTFRPNSTPAPTPDTSESPSRTFSRLSIFPRSPRPSTGEPSQSPKTPQTHNRSSSLSTLNLNTSQTAKRLSSSTTPRWRPSVLGHFYQPYASQSSIQMSESQYTPSRPSISSGEISSTSNTTRTNTTIESNLNIASSPSKVSLIDSIRLRSKRPSSVIASIAEASASSCSVTTPTHRRAASAYETNSISSDYIPEMGRLPFAPKLGSMLRNIDDDDDLDPPPTFRPNNQEKIRPAIPYSSGSLPRVKFSSLKIRSHRKRKKLVVGGIGLTEIRKFEGVKRWCESFGEIRQITRVPNGDLHIDFRDPEVADTVCRVRAKVYIAGVGSVQLSWIYTHKR